MVGGFGMIGICLRCLAIFLFFSPSLLTSIAFASRGRGLGKSILDIIVDGITDNRKLKISKISMQIIFQRVGRSSKSIALGFVKGNQLFQSNYTRRTLVTTMYW